MFSKLARSCQTNSAYKVNITFHCCALPLRPIFLQYIYMLPSLQAAKFGRCRYIIKSCTLLQTENWRNYLTPQKVKKIFSYVFN